MSAYASLPGGAEYLVRVEYPSSEASGITAVVVVSFISLLAVVSLLAVISISALNTRTSLDHHLFVRMHVATYFISLLVGNLLQAVGSIINVTWVASKAVKDPGVVKHVADLSMAIWTFAIAMHTFCLLVLGLKIQRVTMIATVVSGWSGTFALVIIGPAVLGTKGPYFGISGRWCWITEQYPAERITQVFMAAFLSLSLYLLILLHFRGVPVLSGLRAYFRETSIGGDYEFERKGMDIAKKMLLYPVAYGIIVFPIAVTRFSEWAGAKPTFAAIIFSSVLFQMSGIINVCLFLTIGRVLPPQSVNISSLKRGISRPRTFKPPPPILVPGNSDPYYASSDFDPIPPIPDIAEDRNMFPEPELYVHAGNAEFTEHPEPVVPKVFEEEHTVAPLQIRKARQDMLPDIEVSNRLDSVYDYYEREGRRGSQDSYYNHEDRDYATGRSGDSYKDVDLDDIPNERPDSDEDSVYSNEV
ncbi:hypothetical protein D9758_008498 [Tetrapyrgos nigripes]|uniref:Glucose receptor Git3 N-terminal domain-containing protein n=1 Tax=Tetrapyrgos nigripes TaxID=182062 RepID=A0A8H5CQL5_9AGAR|nr:hypothetical protein D9758_008498 [Tetrapyrgos nigripes]